MKRSPTAVVIPPEQRPFNEYQQLRSSFFFRWATLEPRLFGAGIAGVWIGSWILSGPISAWSFPPLRLPFHFFLGGVAGSGVLLGLVLLRLYLGWSYIHKRLSSACVHYEESGWYDGSFWNKPPEDIAKDRLIVEYQVAPILRRLQRTLTIFSLLGITDLACWWLL
jgi:Conserved in the green lineage and diatoms 27